MLFIFLLLYLLSEALCFNGIASFLHQYAAQSWVEDTGG